MTKPLLGAALIIASAGVIAGPLDYNRINLTGELKFADENDSQALNFSLNERTDSGYFFEINAEIDAVDSENTKELQGVWGYSFKADNVDFALSLVGTRQWESTGGATTEKTYNAELTLPIVSNLYLELDYRNTFLEDYKSESYKLSLEGGEFDGFQWEVSTLPKADDSNLTADFYIPTAGDGKWVVGISYVDADESLVGVSGGYHWIFGATAPRKAKAATAIAPANSDTAPEPAGADEEAVDPIAPERIDEYAGMEDKSPEEIRDLKAGGENSNNTPEEDGTEAAQSDDETTADDSANDSESANESSEESDPVEEDYDDELDFLFD